MARLEAIAKGLFYPTPDRVVQAVIRHLTPHGSAGNGPVIRVLDPCCGTGEQVAAVAKSLGGISYGIELSSDRSELAAGNVDKLLGKTSAFGTKLSHGGFSCLFLNPPYDYDDEGQRLEQSFLHHMNKALCPGGVLVFIVPQRRLAASARLLAAHYTNLQLFRFPDPEFAAFGQVVLFGTKKAAPNLDYVLHRQIEKDWPSAVLPILPDFPTAAPFVVPTRPPTEVLFAPLFYDPWLANAEAKRAGLWTKRDFLDLIMPTEQRAIRPLMPLRRGHLAMLIAAGILDNSILEQDGERLLVKGSLTKVMIDVETEAEDTRVQHEILHQTVVTLNLRTWEFETIGDEPIPAADAA